MKAFLITPDEKFIKEVRPIAEKALEKCVKIFKPKKQIQINLAVTNDKFVINKMNGSSGITKSGTLIEVSVNTSAMAWRESVRGTVAHEFNHAVRAQRFAQYNDWNCTLLDSIAAEGLAQCFEEFMTGVIPPWAKAISLPDAKKLWRKIVPILKKKNYSDYQKVFYGYKKEFPQWGGYTLSYLIVKKKAEELNYNWKKLIKMSSKKLVGGGLE